jgi:hypothetical protein
VTVRQKTAHGLLLHPYRSAAQLPLRAPADTLQVNWCGLSSTTAQGECLDHNAFVTQEKSTQKTVAQVVTAGRTRWKVENENNTTLKPKGYHRLYVHPRGLVWGFDPRGDVKPPYVKELVQLVEAYGLDEQNE